MKAIKKCDPKNLVVIVLLALNVLVGVYIAFIKPDAYSLEILKVGGRENMQMAKQLYTSDIYKEQQTTTLKQILDSMNVNTPTETPTETPTTDDTSLSLERDKLVAITSNSYVKGKDDARITIIEYSDFLCPFCKRHYNDQTVENIVAKYPNDVNMIFKQFPIPQLHPTAPLGAQAAVCVGKLGGTDKFYDFLPKAFAASEFTEENLIEMATSLGINKSKFTDCFSSQETIDQVNAEIQEAQSFGINGTPGNLVVDNKKRTYVVIAGAYPMEAFEAEIKKILEN